MAMLQVLDKQRKGSSHVSMHGQGGTSLGALVAILRQDTATNAPLPHQCKQLMVESGRVAFVAASGAVAAVVADVAAAVGAVGFAAGAAGAADAAAAGAAGAAGACSWQSTSHHQPSTHAFHTHTVPLSLQACRAREHEKGRSIGTCNLNTRRSHGNNKINKLH